ncbi:uncharacterized protein LOC127871814 isoform X2 [Dreissena polymorpha]|uniref:uncharacterized protein LOC127871814 isoform X2 n=1 Tax=Dreissena polymorpha TaxID=45954 RepID=UPI002263C1D2|nr:uncharacterized protein LOC127871814 isoform X2 [Dreissena polymorpha]
MWKCSTPSLVQATFLMIEKRKNLLTLLVQVKRHSQKKNQVSDVPLHKPDMYPNNYTKEAFPFLAFPFLPPKIYQQQQQSQQQGQVFLGQQWASNVNQPPKGLFKVPGALGHQRTVSDKRFDHPANNEHFYMDNFNNMNWEDNNFYSQQQLMNHQEWGNQGVRAGRGQFHRGSRRGSFDSSFEAPGNRVSRSDQHNWDGSSHREQPERGRGMLRGTGHRRSMSYDNISPESTSSSDSSLKRRRENEDDRQPGKTRRFVAPDSYQSSSSSGYQSGRTRRLIDEKSNQRPRSRSTSRDRSSSLRDFRSDSESEGRLSARKVTWSDQQMVSSTSENAEKKSYRNTGNAAAVVNDEPVLPDSSSESDLKNLPKHKSRVVNSKTETVTSKLRQSPRSPKKPVIAGDETESVLEKAEKLCKKLRNEREKAKTKKREEEKIKKLEKETELNEKIASLSERNKSNIKGILDSEVEAIMSKRSLSQNDVSFVASAERPNSVQGAASAANIKTLPEFTADTEISKRIAQTQADIAAIRAKIEASVHSESPVQELVSEPPRYPGGTERVNLVKMVNSPRTTKERLALAEMVRKHVVSQNKLSLPRFNLKYSDLCSNSDKQDEYTNINLDSLAPDIKLQIANIIEADVKPDISELQKLLDQASVGNEQLDPDILAELGIRTTPDRVRSNPVFTPSPTLGIPVREKSVENNGNTSTTAAASKEVRNVDRAQSPVRRLFSGNTDEYRTVNGTAKDATSKEKELTTRDQVPANKDKLSSSSWKPDDLQTSGVMSLRRVQSPVNSISSSLPMSMHFTGRAPQQSSSETAPQKNVASPMEVRVVPEVRVKQEKIDSGYDQAIKMTGQTDSRDRQDYVSRTSELQDMDIRMTGTRTVQRSIHTRSLYSTDDIPVREQRHSPGNTTLEKVSKILDAVPAPIVESPSVKTHRPPTSPASPVAMVIGSSPSPPSGASQMEGTGVHEKAEKHLDSSLTSQATILDEVYRVSLHEETVRGEINSVDLKIDRLTSLIEEASQQLNRFRDERKQLLEEEKSCRSKRLKLLEDSRSSSACSQTGAGSLPLHLTSQYADNLVMAKFLMSRPSDLSSVGGYSNVESGSQPDLDLPGQRRGSLTSSTSEPLSAGDLNAKKSNTASLLFSKSLDVLTGSTETVTSSHSKGFECQDFDRTPRASVESGPKEQHVSADKGVLEKKESVNKKNSLSLINPPLDKVGFVTLEALMKGDTDIGKLLNKSIESIEKGIIPKGASPLPQQLSNETDSRGLGLAGRVRERRDSSFSIGSDGSDTERRKVSMKYMGTLPEGMNYESFVRHMSQENKNKNLMFTVFSSPEAVSQLRRTPDAGSKTPTVLSNPASQLPTETGYRSDTNSTKTLTDANDGEDRSIISTFSLGAEIKRICDGHGKQTDGENKLDMVTQRSGTDTLDDLTPRALQDELSLPWSSDVKYTGIRVDHVHESPVRDCSVNLERIDTDSYPVLTQILETPLKSSKSPPPPLIIGEAPSPTRKRLKSKKERDQMSRRKQKESFILNSDTDCDADTGTNVPGTRSRLSFKCASRSEEDLVQSGSEAGTPRIPEKTKPPQGPQGLKRSLLDEVQLEPETPSDSDLSQKQPTQEQVPVVQYCGPSISVACVQVFKQDLYVCYNGSEIRRFHLKAGQVMKELDCSPYLVSCMHVTSVEDRQDILYTGGPCKKLMLFTPQKFNLIATYDYQSRLTSLHENWGRLFVGLSDGAVSVRSLKTDKELNTFSCTTSPIHAMSSTSAGMTKMLCLATGDKVIYILDAITGLLITMLEGHTQPPLCLQVNGDQVVSGGADQSLMVHSATTGSLTHMNMLQMPITSIHFSEDHIYAVCRDKLIRTYSLELKSGQVIECSGIATCCHVSDGMVIIGDRDGLCEGRPLSKLLKCACKFGGCTLEFSTLDHLRLHVLSDHVNTTMGKCSYTGCAHSFHKEDRRQDHMLRHLK